MIKFWTKCNDYNKNIFDININVTSNTIYYNGTTFFIPSAQLQFTNLLSSNEVCSIDYPSSNDILKCFREFYYLWINILFESMIIMIFMPIFIIILKIIKNKLYKKNYLYITTDSEYL